MLEVIQKIWAMGAADQPARVARQVTLINQIAMLASFATAPYVIYYLAADWRYYLPILFANLAFISGYAGCVVLNRLGRFEAARNLILGLICAHLLTVTALISTAAGVHLFYVTLSASSGLIFPGGHNKVILVLLAVASVLFGICHFFFPPGSTFLTVPHGVAHLMYLWSASGASLVAGALAIFYRGEIDRAELALTRSHEELERLSSQDPLTGLANRRTLDDFLAREISRAWRQEGVVSLLLCDVDSFKAYNDHYGHPAGDECLRIVAGVFAEAARRPGDLAARYGGEEFALVLAATEADAAHSVAERLRRRVMERRLTHNHAAVADVVTISCGLVTARAREIDGPAALIRMADEALYVAKQTGRNRIVAYESRPAHNAEVAPGDVRPFFPAGASPG